MANEKRIHDLKTTIKEAKAEIREYTKANKIDKMMKKVIELTPERQQSLTAYLAAFVSSRRLQHIIAIYHL